VQKRTPVNHSHLFASGIWSRRDAMTLVPMDNANDPTFWIKELNPFDPGLDLRCDLRCLEGNE